MTSIAGQLVTESFAYDDGRPVTVYIPPDSPQRIVVAGDGAVHRAEPPRVRRMRALTPIEFVQVLAHAHARTGDPAMIAGYLGKASGFDNALADFAIAYAD